MERLAVSPDEFRELSSRAVEITTRYLERLRELPAFPSTSGDLAAAAFDRPLPERGMGAAALEDLAKVLALSRPCGPGFFGYVLGSGEPVAAVADFVASVLNQNVTAWRSSPAAVTIEHTVVRWLAEAIGCSGFIGSLTGGGSTANLMALAMARSNAHEGTLYASTEAHMSIPKAAALLGFGRGAVRPIAIDEHFRMRPEVLDRAIRDDLAAGRRPIAVIATAGTVSTGS